MTERYSTEGPMGLDSITATDQDQFSNIGLGDRHDAPMTSFESGADIADGSGDHSSSGANGSGDRLQEAAGSVAGRMADTAQDKVGTQVDSQLTRVGDVLEQLAGAVRQGGEGLRGQQPQIAGFADTAAQQVDRASQFLRHTDMQGLMRTAEGFGRRQPAVFLGGALALGLIASRLLKASPQDASKGSDVRGSSRNGASSPSHDWAFGSANGSGHSTGTEAGRGGV